MTEKDIPKVYEPGVYEDAIYRAWEESGFFNPDTVQASGPSFSIILPPPNVTGTLHIGHAMMLAIEDLLIRYHRMKGDRTLWIPGTDHAAIATQNKVERILWEEDKKTRHDLGREKFLEKVWKYVRTSQDTIHRQMRKMGSSMDWSREAFTLDEPRVTAVRTIFKRMYDDGLIYQGNRIVNWCTRCQSTLADDEVLYKEEKAPFYYIQYGPVVIGTARPETKFADKVIIVHPEDKRYAGMNGKKISVPWINGEIKATFVADPAADPEFGSGAMTITPAHSFEDFDLAQKYGFEILQIINTDGRMTEVAGEFAGMKVRECREKLVEKMKQIGLITRVDENYAHNLSVCYRCETPVEPLVSTQWFIAVNKKFTLHNSKIQGIESGAEVTLKELMQIVVRSGQIQIIPDRFNKTYFHWIDNLRDWCISRQIWFGHQIPVWYRAGETYVGTEEPTTDGWTQDPDTLDTWFSAGVWTFSTLGWPAESEDLKRFHPTSVLETGYDILFFWVARMILMTTYAVGEIPFEKVYLHGLVRDEKGRKMSKSLGNVIDPLDVAQKYGTDAVRLSLVIGQTPGNDSRLSEEKIAGFRNFTNKLWNIGRYVLMTIQGDSCALEDPPRRTLADEWIWIRLQELTYEVTRDIEAFAFSAAGEKLRAFTWNEFADWYLEISKIQKNDALLFAVYRTLLKLWHPFMPFVTEELWKIAGGGEKPFLLIEEWPKPQTTNQESNRKEVVESFTFIQEIVTAIRNVRATMHIARVEQMSVVIVNTTCPFILEEQAEVIKTLARISSFTIETQEGKTYTQAVSVILKEGVIYVLLEGLLDVSTEQRRLQKELEDVYAYCVALEKKLQNTEFIERAPKEIVAKEEQKLVEAKEKKEKIKRKLTSLHI